MLLTITDTAGTSGTVTTDKDTVADAIRGWYPDAPDDVTAALDELQTALDRGDQAKVGDLAVALAISIKPARDADDDRTYGYVDQIPPA